MKILAINGSPRKQRWNTVNMLNGLLEGAADAGAETELVHLVDLQFSGCISCFSCKKKTRKIDGACAVNDDLTPLLAQIRDIDALVIGSPVYYGTESAATRAFIERLCFPFNPYRADGSSLFPRQIRTALVYTMNVSDSQMETFGYQHHFALMQATMARHFGPCELLLATDTLQYSDYDKYESGRFDAAAKQKRHAEIFPQELQRAFELGRNMVRPL